VIRFPRRAPAPAALAPSLLPAPGGAGARWRARAWRLVRCSAGLATWALAVLLLVRETWYRGLEAAVAGHTISGWLGYPVLVARARQTVFFAFHGTGSAHMLGLVITLGCSSDLLLVPILLTTGVLLCVGSASPFRVTAASALAAAIVIFINMLRLVMIAALVSSWGVQAGFGWGHTLFGSVLTLLGMFVALAAFVLVVGRARGARAA
jgi:exosortase/archaeosortase family protein